MAFSQEPQPQQDKPEKKKADRYLPKGNEQYEAKEYTACRGKLQDIRIEYRLQMLQAAYNLGNAIYRQETAGRGGICLPEGSGKRHG